MNVPEYVNKVTPKKYKEGNYVPQDFDIVVVEIDATKEGMNRFVGLTTPNASLKANNVILPEQEYIIAQFVPKMVRSTEGKRVIGGDSESNRILPVTVFARRDQLVFDDLKTEIARFISADTDDKKNKIMTKLPIQRKFTRFNGKSVMGNDDLALKNMWKLNEASIRGNLVTFPVLQGYYIVNVDATGKRTLAKLTRTDWQGNVIKGNEQPVILFESTVFVRHPVPAEVAIRAQLSTLPLVSEIEDWGEQPKEVADMDTDAITEQLVNASEPEEEIPAAPTGTTGK